MSDEDTLKYYNMCGFDFYTMHPYSQTFDRAMQSAKKLNDKPLLFTEWGGHFVYNNPKLLGEFINEMYNLYLSNSKDGALAGASFWSWSEINDFNRGGVACVDGNLCEGLVDKYRKPTLIYQTFCDSLARMENPPKVDFWLEANKENLKLGNTVDLPKSKDKILSVLNELAISEANSYKMRKRCIKNGPVLSDVTDIGINDIPLVIADNETVEIKGGFKTEGLTLLGLTSITKGYPLGGKYGEPVAEIIITYSDKTVYKTILKNGIDITTVFGLNGSSRINPVAEKSKRVAVFGYDKNFESYILNKATFTANCSKTIEKIEICSSNNGYTLLIYAIGY